MASRQTTELVRATNELVAFGRANATLIGTSLEARVADLGLKPKADWATTIIALCDLTGAAARDAQERDGAMHSGSHSDPTAARDESVRKVRAALRSVHQGVLAAYGPDNAMQAFKGKTPKDPYGLSTHAEEIATRLAGVKWTMLPEVVVKIDLPAASKKLSKLATELRAAAAAASEDGATIHAERGTRAASLARLHDLTLGLKMVLVGALEAAGEHDLATHATVHHHLGHAIAVEAPGDPGGTPSDPAAPPHG